MQWETIYTSNFCIVFTTLMNADSGWNYRGEYKLCTSPERGIHHDVAYDASVVQCSTGTTEFAMQDVSDTFSSFTMAPDMLEW